MTLTVMPPLTVKEREIGLLLLEGKTVAQIATLLALPEVTVKIRGWSVCDKLEAWDREEMQKRRHLLDD